MKPFQKRQFEFTGNIRDPDGAPAPRDIEDRRMEIYRDLLYKNVQSFLAGCFPVLRRICSDERWHSLVRDYFRNHRAHTPLFPKMPQEFLHYLEHERGIQPGDFPFLLELAHYEWVELALSIDPREIDLTGIDADGDLLGGIPVLSPLAWPFAYRFPVHRIKPDFLPETAPDQPTYLVIYRDLEDQIGFLELNPVSARLVELMQQESGRTGRELMQQIVVELQHPDPAVVIQGGLEILEALRGKNVVPGVRAR
ncbi:MAG: putative DNA-binding domain-containing protein [Gammaproteobacteria bacterium]|nr:putative DNA-binding domain-containing protein [Gammaproteobacteria bacterium]